MVIIRALITLDHGINMGKEVNSENSYLRYPGDDHAFYGIGRKILQFL